MPSQADLGLAVGSVAGGLAITPFATLRTTVTPDEIEAWEQEALDLIDEELDDPDLEGESEQDARDNMSLLVLSGRSLYEGLTDRMMAGKLTPRAWGVSLATDLVVRSTATSLVLLGARKLLKPQRADLAEELDGQLGYLDRFRQGVSSGAVPLDGRARNRAGQYGDSGWRTAMAIQLASMVRVGARYGRRELGSAKHCGPCLEYANRGWEPIDEVVPIGDTPCGSRCHCWIEYR